MPRLATRPSRRTPYPKAAAGQIRASTRRRSRPRRYQETRPHPRRWAPQARPHHREPQQRKQGRGYVFLHDAVDDHSRIAYSEILENERKDTAADFWHRANTYFASIGITVKEVLIDNGSCYRSHAFRDTLANTNITHRRTRVYCPQTEGKVERFNRTLAQKWTYASTYDGDEARAATYDTWLHHYNHHRPHTVIKGATPSERVHNLTTEYKLGPAPRPPASPPRVPQATAALLEPAIASGVARAAASKPALPSSPPPNGSAAAAPHSHEPN
ncbi:transposase family protein [Pseudoclavibacter sp. Marseille-Q4354]|nr:transposase family protein [Pseudoclavibacter sp. Marseille-Q4354]